MEIPLCFSVIGYATASALLSETVAWLMIYRTDDYHRLKNNLDRANKRLDKKKLEEPVAALKSTTTVGSKGSKGSKPGTPNKSVTKFAKTLLALLTLSPPRLFANFWSVRCRPPVIGRSWSAHFRPPVISQVSGLRINTTANPGGC